MDPMKGADTTAASTASFNDNAMVEDGASVIELSVEETNALRAQLGLKPLRQTEEVDVHEDHGGRTARSAYHKPAENIGERSMVQQRIEEAKLKRQVQKGMERFITEAAEIEKKASSYSTSSSAVEWANKMRVDQQRRQQEAKEEEINSNDLKFKEESTSSELLLDHLNVAHSLEELTATTSTNINSLAHETILTLRDESILDYDEHGMALVGVRDMSDNILENVNLTDDQKARENLRKKRQLELGAGRAGGYAGWDDDEFDELGGIGWNHANGHHPTSSSTKTDYENSTHKKVRRLVELVQDTKTNLHSTNEDQQLFASKQSLQQQPSDVSSCISNRILSDYLSSDQVAKDAAKEEKRRRKLLDKEKKLFKKLKKQQEKKKHFRSATDDEENDIKGTEEKDLGDSATSYPQSYSIVDQLEATAVNTNQAHHRGGRSQGTAGSSGDERPGEKTTNVISSNRPNEDNTMTMRRQKFEYALQKGNLRTKRAFHLHDQPQSEDNQKLNPDEIVSSSSAAALEEEDDAVLIAALSKAQRLKKLKEMQQQANSAGAEAVNEKIIHPNFAVGDTAAADAVDTSTNNRNTTQGGLTFEFNQTKEFSHALRSISDSTTMKRSKKSASSGVAFTSKKVKKVENDESASRKEGDNADVTMEDVATMDNILSDEEGDDDEVGGFGSMANTKPLDRGLAGALSLLRATGDITGKHAGKEDMCGRAKDERTYEDYEPLNLNEVVKIDTKSATSKDIEFANREVKLDYRDEHGRLLTRKEAWRHLCYQFHGYSSSYKNEEKRMKQLAQERAERAKQNEMLERGTLGALKATQKATGKAFILHKKI